MVGTRGVLRDEGGNPPRQAVGGRGLRNGGLAGLRIRRPHQPTAGTKTGGERESCIRADRRGEEEVGHRAEGGSSAADGV